MRMNENIYLTVSIVFHMWKENKLIAKVFLVGILFQLSHTLIHYYIVNRIC